jgi:Domain of unknown function (DUF4340)
VRPKSFVALAAVTLVMVIAALWAVGAKRAPTMIATDRDRAFPALAEKLNDVDTIEVVAGEEKFTIKRADGAWTMVEKGGYPVRFDKVKTALVGLAELTLLETKTADPERYDRLDVQAPGAKEARSKRIVVKDTGGNLLADGIIGKRNPSLFGTKGGTYLRIKDDSVSWLAEGTVEIGPTPNDWLDRKIVNIVAEDVRRVVITQPDGAVLALEKTDAKQKDFTVTGIPEGRKVKSASEANGLAGGLWRLDLEDVKPAADFTFPDKFVTAELTTFGGFKVRAETARVDDEYWARFTATADPVPADDKAEKDDKPAKDDKAEKKAPSVKELADDLNRTATGWVYRLSPGEGERLSTKVEEILEKPKKKAS